jgi:hypothetical protein
MYTSIHVISELDWQRYRDAGWKTLYVGRDNIVIALPRR